MRNGGIVARQLLLAEKQKVFKLNKCFINISCYLFYQTLFFAQLSKHILINLVRYYV